MNSIQQLGKYQFEWLNKYGEITLSEWRLFCVDNLPKWIYVGNWNPSMLEIENGAYEEREKNILQNPYFYWPGIEKQNKEETILRTHEHKLRFKIDSDAPAEYMGKWHSLKKACETGDTFEICTEWKDNCELLQNKNLPLLDSCEGGLGGNDNKLHKQIRFRHGYYFAPWDRDNDIIVDRVYETNGEKWSYAELDDLMMAFIKTANARLDAECVRGCIELISP